MPIVKFLPVDSSYLSAIGHDEKTSTLYVKFRNKKVFSYHPIEKQAFEDFKKSESKGVFFHKNIQNNSKLKAELSK